MENVCVFNYEHNGSENYRHNHSEEQNFWLVNELISQFQEITTRRKHNEPNIQTQHFC